MSKGYVIGNNKITNDKEYKLYAEKVPATIEMFGGRFLARGGDTVILDGEPNGNRNVLIEFPSVESAKAWYFSKEYQNIVQGRLQNADGYLLIVEGL
tara:strand:+ start:40 stop:330 length:291 start_codon:yes stop_codon:yes gene_type:complete